MERKTIQINNLKIQWNKGLRLWQVLTPAMKAISYSPPRGKKYRLVLEEFRTKVGAVRFAKNTTDYLKWRN